MYKLKLKHGFSSAHQLTNAYSSECNDFVHGHNWKVEIDVWSKELDKGMIVDFKRLKEEINKLDHKFLNSVIDFEPTAENLSQYLQSKVREVYFEKHNKYPEFCSVVLFETDNASITYED